MHSTRSNYSAMKESWLKDLSQIRAKIDKVDEAGMQRTLITQSERLKLKISGYNGNPLEYVDINDQMKSLSDKTIDISLL